MWNRKAEINWTNFDFSCIQYINLYFLYTVVQKKCTKPNNEGCLILFQVKSKHFLASWPAEEPVEIPSWRGRSTNILQGIALNFTIHASYENVPCNNPSVDSYQLPDDPSSCCPLKALIIIALKDFLYTWPALRRIWLFWSHTVSYAN